MLRAVRLPRAAACVLLLPVLLSARTVRCDAADLTSYRPQQGAVFDGASTAGRTWYVDFSGSGFQFEHRIPFFLCPGAPRDAIDEILRVAPERAVFQSSAVLAVFDGFARRVTLELPPLVAALSDDCELLDEFAAVQDFLQDVLDRSASILAQIDLTLAALRDAFCDARSAILDAPILGAEEQGFLPPLSGGGGGSPGGPIPALCSVFVERLDELVARVNAMEVKRGNCALLLDRMEDVPDLILQRILDTGGLSVDERNLALAVIDALLALAEDVRQEAVALDAAITASVATYTVEAVSLSCEPCQEEGATGASVPARLTSPPVGDGDESEAVIVRHTRAPLDRYVRSLWRAVTQARDRREALRLLSLAFRLSAVPSCRVLHVTYRGSAGIGQEYVALRAPCHRGARGAPWAVVLTVLPVDAPLPDPTPDEQRRLFDAIDAFNTLVPPAEGAASAPTPTFPGRVGPWRRTRQAR